MERSEPTLVPEWLKGTAGSITVGAHHSSASSLQSEDPLVTLPMRNRSSDLGDRDTPRSSAFTDRTSTASYFRRSSSSNGSMNQDKDPSAYSSRPYSSFGRNHRNRDRDKDLDVRDKERSSSLFGGDHHRVYDYSDSLTDILTSRIEKDSLRHSQSMVSGKRGEVWPRRAGKDTNNGPLIGKKIVSSVHKASFERDFPSLGTEEKQGGVSDIGRVSSPVLSSTATQSLSMATSPVVIGGDGWTSALAEVPVIISNNLTLASTVQQPASSSSASMLLSTTTGLNMAETLAKAPSRARSVPQLSVDTQRLEELAIKQSRQLVPMTPSIPKTSVLNSTEKPKPKTARTGELSAVTKVGQQCSSSQVVNHPLRGPTARSDTTKTSQAGKLLVLKAVREKNGVSTTSPTAKDGLSPTNSSRVVNNRLGGVVPSAAYTGFRGHKNPKLPADCKPAAASSVIQMCVDKKPLSQAQNRSDFFNSLRKKTSVNHSSTATIPELGPPVVNKSGEQQIQVASVSHENDVSPTLDSGLDNASSMAGSVEEPERILNEGEDKCSSSDEVVDPDEEEAAFLRSLGWEENAAEEEALTEEEINAFYKEYMKLRPSSKLGQGLQQVKIAPLESHIGSLVAAASGLSSIDAEESEAA